MNGALKKSLSFVLVITMLFGLSTTAFADSLERKEASKIIDVTIESGSILMIPSETQNIRYEYDTQTYNFKETTKEDVVSIVVSLKKPIDNLAGKDFKIYLPNSFKDVKIVNNQLFTSYDVNANFTLDDFGMASLQFDEVHPLDLIINTKKNSMTTVTVPSRLTDFTLTMNKGENSMVTLLGMGYNGWANSFIKTKGTGEKTFTLSVGENAMLSFVS